MIAFAVQATNRRHFPPFGCQGGEKGAPQNQTADAPAWMGILDFFITFPSIDFQLQAGAVVPFLSDYKCNTRISQSYMMCGCRVDKGWYNSGYIFPDGFKSRVLFRSSVALERTCLHECFVLGKSGAYFPLPTFKVTALDRPEEPVIAKSCTGCWTQVTPPHPKIRKYHQITDKQHAQVRQNHIVLTVAPTSMLDVVCGSGCDTIRFESAAKVPAKRILKHYRISSAPLGGMCRARWIWQQRMLHRAGMWVRLRLQVVWSVHGCTCCFPDEAIAFKECSHVVRFAVQAP